MLIVGVMGQDCMRFLPMCLESLKDADRIIYIDGGSKDNSVEYAKEKGCEIIINQYNQEDLGMNGKQRNEFLKYLKDKYPNEWCIFCDADEVVEDLDKVKEFIQNAQEGLYYFKMRHFIGDLGHEDSTQPIHLAPNRLFKISCADKYPEVEHPVLQPKDASIYQYRGTTIWHLAYVPNSWEFLKRYKNHLKKSNMHTPEFLKNWYWQHLFGQYPRTQINLLEIPEIILKNFEVDKEELYFIGRDKVQVNHYQDAIDWKKHFNLKTAILWGCGFGQRVKILRDLGIDAVGYEISKYPIKDKDYLFQRDITDPQDLGIADLVVAYDVLEHLDYKDLDQAIENLKGGKNILVSIPFLGDPNLENDPTHKIKESREWWIEQFKKHNLKLVKTPDHFLFKDQILIFKEKK